MLNLPLDESRIRDEEVFQALNLDHPGLEDVRTAWLVQDLPQAKKALAAYWETRSNIAYLLDYRQIPMIPMDVNANPYAYQAAMGLHDNLKAFCLYGADQMVNHIYVRPGRKGEVDLGPNFENMIHFDFINDQGKKHRSLLDNFVRGQFFEYLAVAYHETGKTIYLDTFKEMFNLFFETYPLKVEKTSPDADRFQYCDERDVMSVGWLITVLTNLLYTRLSYDAGPDYCFEIFKHIWFLGIQFRRFDTDTLRPYNHHLWERGLLPYLLAVTFPEVPAFTAMKPKAIDVINYHVGEDFNGDGGYNEHSLAYMGGAALGEMLSRGITLARLNGETLLLPHCLERINRCFDVLAAIAPPEKEYPSIGDNRAPVVQHIMHLGESTTGNTWCSWRGKPHASADRGPIPLAIANDQVGFVCARSDFSDQANYILMSAKCHCGTSGHNHMDMLSLCVTFRGQPIIGEPYYRLYHSIKMGSDLRGYMYNMSSHNTVLAHGEPILPNRCYANRWGVFRPDSPITHFKEHPHGMSVSAYHDGYTYVRHTRKAAFFNDKGLLVCDEIFPGNRLKEPHVQRWHLMPNVKVEQLSSSALLLTTNTARVLMLSSNAESLSIYRNESLYPDIMPSRDMLYPIIDISFRLINADQPGRPAARTSLLLLDVTDRHYDLKHLAASLACIESNPSAENLYDILETL